MENEPARPDPPDILLVEDNAGDVLLVREGLREGRVAATLHWARDGDEALRFARREAMFTTAPVPDLILLDLNLPRADGRAVLAELRQETDIAAVPIVVWSSSRAERDMRESYALGANAFVPKPLAFDELISTLRSVCRFWLPRHRR
jgi:two-component system response regulator